MPRAGNYINYETRLLRVLDYIHGNLDGDLSLDTLAEVACMSPHHWHRVFRAMTGETLAEAIRRIRFVKAGNALVNEDAPLAQIAARFGYANLDSFSRTFRTIHGTSPDAFRKKGIQINNELRQASGDHTMYPVTIQDLTPSRAAGVLHVGPYAQISSAFHKLGGIIGARGLFPHIRGMIAIYHDAPDSKPEADLRSHAALIIADTCPQDIEGLEYFDLTGGKHAVMEHSGPYATLGSAYEWLYGKWLPESGEEPSDAPPIELYVNNPQDTPPDQLRTDIRLPLV